MITLEQAKELLIKKYPKLQITKAVDYDDEHYVIEAVEDLEKTDYNSPYYGVDKNTGEVTSFSPGADLDYFFDKMGIEDADEDEVEEESTLFDSEDEETIQIGKSIVSRFFRI